MVIEKAITFIAPVVHAVTIIHFRSLTQSLNDYIFLFVTKSERLRFVSGQLQSQLYSMSQSLHNRRYIVIDSQ